MLADDVKIDKKISIKDKFPLTKISELIKQ